MNIPVHCLGFALNPYYYDTNYLQSPAPSGKPRRAPNCDREVVQGVLKAFDKIGEDEEERRVLRHQLASFQGKEDKLVYIHTNIRLISRFTSSYKEGPYRKWDIDAENSYLEDSMAKLDELRSKDDGIEEKSETPVISASKRKRYSD
ncbi:hypothetical protein AgCh_034045 [Apium graveolens]